MHTYTSIYMYMCLLKNTTIGRGRSQKPVFCLCLYSTLSTICRNGLLLFLMHCAMLDLNVSARFVKLVMYIHMCILYSTWSSKIRLLIQNHHDLLPKVAVKWSKEYLILVVDFHKLNKSTIYICKYVMYVCTYKCMKAIIYSTRYYILVLIWRIVLLVWAAKYNR